MIFYGVYIKDRRLSFLFDLIRLLAQPDALRRAHITVRGPYKNRIDISRFNERELGDLAIVQPGHFLFNKQRTVFLRCEIVGIRDVWNKPNYQDGVVHMTIYDGPSEFEALEIIELLRCYEWNIWTRPTSLVELTKKVINTENIYLTEPDFAMRFVTQFKNYRNMSHLKKETFPKRKQMIKIVLDEMRAEYMPSFSASRPVIRRDRM